MRSTLKPLLRRSNILGVFTPRTLPRTQVSNIYGRPVDQLVGDVRPQVLAQISFRSNGFGTFLSCKASGDYHQLLATFFAAWRE